MQENRKSIRVNLLNPPEIYDAHSNELLGNMVDISLGGFKIITNNQMEQGKEYLLSINLPEGICDSKSVVVKADVRWCSKDINPNWCSKDINPNLFASLFASGCYFVQIEAKGRIDLAVLMLNGAKS
jgi:hypothetical protein